LNLEPLVADRVQRPESLGDTDPGQRYREEWLRALERANLKLRPSGHRSTGNDSALAEAQRAVTPRTAVAPGIQGQTVTEHQAVAPRAGTGTSGDQGAQAVRAALSPSGPTIKAELPLASAEAVITRPLVSSAGVVEGDASISAAEGDQHPKKSIWEQVHVVVHPTSSGVEVWVRDSTLAGQPIVDLLRDLRRSMSELGASLVRLTVNGRMAWQAGTPPKVDQAPGDNRR
jgi:hypothetical protein